jgi:hypothetical protein
MRISKMIRDLEKLKKKHGDVYLSFFFENTGNSLGFDWSEEFLLEAEAMHFNGKDVDILLKENKL